MGGQTITGGPTMLATIAGREELLGIPAVTSWQVTPSARALTERVPSAGCVMVRMGTDFLDPATGRIRDDGMDDEV